MAVQISANHMVSIIYPKGVSFTWGEIHEQVGSKIEPLCFDHFWLIYDEMGHAKKKPLNQIASLVFGVPLYGEVITIPTQQMPDDWEVSDLIRSDYQIEDIDNGVLLTIQKAIDYQRKVNQGQEPVVALEEWIYDPDGEVQTKGDIDLFYSSVYDFIVENPHKFHQKNIIFSDMFLEIKLPHNQAQISIVRKMIKHFEELEIYEKCLVLKKDFIEQNISNV
jgi:hypothetical protein